MWVPPSDGEGSGVLTKQGSRVLHRLWESPEDHRAHWMPPRDSAQHGPEQGTIRVTGNAARHLPMPPPSLSPEISPKPSLSPAHSPLPGSPLAGRSTSLLALESLDDAVSERRVQEHFPLRLPTPHRQHFGDCWQVCVHLPNTHLHKALSVPRGLNRQCPPCKPAASNFRLLMQ